MTKLYYNLFGLNIEYGQQELVTGLNARRYIYKKLNFTGKVFRFVYFVTSPFNKTSPVYFEHHNFMDRIKSMYSNLRLAVRDFNK